MEWTVNKTATTRLDLPGGNWIDVRQALTVGEERAIARKSARSYQQGQAIGEDQGRITIDYDVTRFGIVQAAAYIVAWSCPVPWFVNLSLDKRVEIIENNLSTPAQIAIEEAITAWLKDRDAERSAEKKDQGIATGETASTPISESPAP